MTAVDEKLKYVRYNVDREPHIMVDTKTCSTCTHRACTYCCPAELYVYGGDGLEFSYEGCLECGACYTVCDLGAVRWSYPRGGFGVAFRFG